MDCDTVWNVVSALAAVVAVGFALATVLETRALRREERLARLPELVADLAEKLIIALSGTFGQTPTWSVAHAARERLRATLTASTERLPACEAMLESPIYPASEVERAHRTSLDAIDAAVTAATGELAALLRAHARPGWWRR